MRKPAEETKPSEQVTSPSILPDALNRPQNALQRKKSKSLTPKSPQHMSPLWKALDARIGGREGLLEAAMASSNPKAKMLVDLILDGSANNRKMGTKKLAEKAGFTTAEVVDLFRDQKWLESLIVLHQDLPEIIQGAATDAKPSFVPCEVCKGVTQEPPCWVCKGKGEVRKSGDKEKLNFIGKAAGLIDKGGPVVQVNTQVNTIGGSGESFENLMRKATVTVVRKAIEPIREAEVVDVE